MDITDGQSHRTFAGRPELGIWPGYRERRDFTDGFLFVRREFAGIRVQQASSSGDRIARCKSLSIRELGAVCDSYRIAENRYLILRQLTDRPVVVAPP